MSAGQWIAAGLGAALPLALAGWVLRRSTYLRMLSGLWAATIATAAGLALPVIAGEKLLQQWVEIEPARRVGGWLTLLLYQFLVAAPVEMAVMVLAMAPYWRLRRMRMRAGLSRAVETKEGVTFAVLAGLGFVTVRNFGYLWRYRPSWVGLLRVELGLLTVVLLCGLWGWVLGRNAARGLGGRRFSMAWLGTTVFLGVTDELIFHRSTVALTAMVPLLLSMLLVAWVLWRDLGPAAGRTSSGRMSMLMSVPAPSLAAIREAFRRHDRPLTLRWIGLGALVTTGMIVTGLTAAVLLGHELGVDFSVVDRAEPGAASIAPLVLLGCGAIAAFPGSGYLLARASGTRSVLEPAMATSLAMVLMMVLIGMAAPTSVVFAIAFAPIAFALSCIGAWVGLGR